MWKKKRWVIICILKSESWGKRKIPGTEDIKREKTSGEEVHLRLQDICFICDWLKCWPDNTHELSYLSSALKWGILNESKSNRGNKGRKSAGCIVLPLSQGVPTESLPQYQLSPSLLSSGAWYTRDDHPSIALATGEQGPQQGRQAVFSWWRNGPRRLTEKEHFGRSCTTDIFWLLGRALFQLFNEIPSKAWLFCPML